MSKKKEELILIPSSWASTTRDQFAMAALSGLIAGIDKKMTEEDAARVAYRVADAMLAERDKK